MLQYTRIHSLLVNGIVTASSHALWSVLSNKVIWVLGHVQICRLWVRHSPCCTLFLINCFGIEMVVCNLYLKRFDLTNGLLFDTFSITVWYKVCHYDHSVLRVRIIFTTNELVDRTRNFKSNASRCRQKNKKKMRRKPDFLWNKMRRRQDLSNKIHSSYREGDHCPLRLSGLPAAHTFFWVIPTTPTPKWRWVHRVRCGTKCATGQIFWPNPHGYSVLLI